MEYKGVEFIRSPHIEDISIGDRAELLWSESTLRQYFEQSDSRSQLIRRLEKLCGIELEKASFEKKDGEEF
jgi:hypothetical protein